MVLTIDHFQFFKMDFQVIKLSISIASDSNKLGDQQANKQLKFKVKKNIYG